MSDNQIKNSLTCNICDGKAIGVFGGKWICGLCLLKIETKIREQKQRFYEIVEKEIQEELKGDKSPEK